MPVRAPSLTPGRLSLATIIDHVVPAWAVSKLPRCLQIDAMAHLTHKLPWATLAASFPVNPDPHGRKPQGAEAFEKRVEHFAGALAAAVAEFAATDARAEEEKAAYDVGTWESGFSSNIALYGAGAVVGFVDSVINGYVALNLLVEDERRVRPGLFDRQYSYVLAVNAGFHDGSHPEWLANQLKPLLADRFGDPKPLDADVVGGIRDYCAELFKCMYTRPDLFTRDTISRKLWVTHKLFYRY